MRQIYGHDCVGQIGAGPNLTNSGGDFAAVANQRATAGSPVEAFHQSSNGSGTSQDLRCRCLDTLLI